jgi:hypothetical protein
MARRSVWNSVYFISKSEGEYDWDIEILCESTQRVKRKYVTKGDHIDDVKRVIRKQLSNNEKARIDGNIIVSKY